NVTGVQTCALPISNLSQNYTQSSQARTKSNLNDTYSKKITPNHLSATHLFQSFAPAVAGTTPKLVSSEPLTARTAPKLIQTEPAMARITPKQILSAPNQIRLAPHPFRMSHPSLKTAPPSST